MPDRSTLRARVLAGETLFGTFLNLGSPLATEISARSGLDWVLVDLEHGVTDEGDLLSHLHAVKGTAATPIVRVEQGTRLRIGRALDLGADGIMVPQVSSVEEARDIVSWLRYPPAGRRGIAPFTRGLDFGSGGHASVDSRNEQIVGILQVESPVAVAAADGIAALDGVDVLFVGPTDLTHAMGIRGQIDHPAFLDAARAVAVAALAHGKAAGVLVWKPADIAPFAALGYTFFALNGEGQMLNSAVRAVLESARVVAAESESARV